MQLMFVCSTYRITGLDYTYGCATLSAAYVGYLYLQNHWLHYTYGCVTLSAEYVCYLYLQIHWVLIPLLVSYLN